MDYSDGPNHVVARILTGGRQRELLPQKRRCDDSSSFKDGGRGLIPRNTGG